MKTKIKTIKVTIEEAQLFKQLIEIATNDKGVLKQLSKGQTELFELKGSIAGRIYEETKQKPNEIVKSKIEEKREVLKRLSINQNEMMKDYDSFAETIIDAVLDFGKDTCHDFNILTNRYFPNGTDLFELVKTNQLKHNGKEYKHFQSVKGYLYDIYIEVRKEYAKI